MSKNFTKYFKIKKYSRGYDKKNKKIISDMIEEIDSKDIQKVIKVVGIEDTMKKCMEINSEIRRIFLREILRRFSFL